MAILIRPAARIKKVKAGNAEEVLYKLQSFLDNNMEEPVEILCGFWEDQQNAITYQELREAVKAGALNETLFQMWSQDYSVLVRGRLSGLWENAMKAGSMSQPVMQRKNFEFNMQTPGIMNWINRRGAEFVTSVSSEQKQAIQSLLVKKMIERHTVDELARLIRPCIGLTKGQAQANIKYYDNIVATLKKDHPRMKTESIQRKAQDAALKYAERQHRQRAMTIAQTESAFAYNRGADEGIRQAQEQGLMGEVIKRWCTSGDHNVCGTCQGLEGVEVGMDKGFRFKGRQLFAEQNLLPPAHPRCACAVEYIETSPAANHAKTPSNISDSPLLGEEREFLSPQPEESQEYKEVKIDTADVRSDAKSGIVISSQRVTTAENMVYVSNNVNLSRRTLHKIDTSITQAAAVLGMKDIGKLPPIVIAAVTEMNLGTLASYVPYTNVIFINEYIADRKVLLNSQIGFASSKNSIATYVHELIHWMDAEQYRAKHGVIDKDYIPKLREKHKKSIAKLAKHGYNIYDISEYASDELKKKHYDEAYTEYRVKKFLGE